MADPETDGPVEQIVEFTEAVETTLTAEMALLRRKMLALGQLMPGVQALAGDAPTTDQAEIESGFDNMPV